MKKPLTERCCDDREEGPVREAMLLQMVSVSSQAALLSSLHSYMTRGQGFAVATMNLDHTVKLRRDPAFRRAYASHTHITADGRPIVWLSRLAARPVSLVTGSDLVDPLAGLCAELDIPIALLGSTPDVLDKAAARLRSCHSALKIAAALSPPMGFDPKGDDAERFIDKLGQSEARVCFLALGAPKQEIFASRALQALPSVGFVSVGAGIDFVAGTQVRAPRLTRAMALEWLWRLLCNPRRLFLRYVSCITILPALTRDAVSLRLTGWTKSIQ